MTFTFDRHNWRLSEKAASFRLSVSRTINLDSWNFFIRQLRQTIHFATNGISMRAEKLYSRTGIRRCLTVWDTGLQDKEFQPKFSGIAIPVNAWYRDAGRKCGVNKVYGVFSVPAWDKNTYFYADTLSGYVRHRPQSGRLQRGRGRGTTDL